MLHSHSIFLSFNSLVLTWWPWARCLWPWCYSGHPSCRRHAPSGRLTTTSWSWIRWPCQERKFNLLNATSGVFWVPIRWCCPTLFPDTQQHAQRRGQQYLSYRCKTPLRFENLCEMKRCIASTDDRQWVSFDSICNSWTTIAQPGLTGFCKFSSIPVCIMQIRNEQDANLFFIHILPNHKSKLGGWKSGVEVRLVIVYLPFNVTPKIFFSPWPKPDPDLI